MALEKPNAVKLSNLKLLDKKLKPLSFAKILQHTIIDLIEKNVNILDNNIYFEIKINYCCMHSNFPSFSM